MEKKEKEKRNFLKNSTKTTMTAITAKWAIFSLNFQQS